MPHKNEPQPELGPQLGMETHKVYERRKKIA